MNELLIMRHGKASSDYGKGDYLRKLKKKGVKQSRYIGKWLDSQDLVVDQICSSPAARALQTAQIVCEELGVPVTTINELSVVYDGEYSAIWSKLVKVCANYKRVLLVGHMPILQDLVEWLIDDDLDGLGYRFSTGCLARLKMNHEDEGARLVDFVVPEI